MNIVTVGVMSLLALAATFFVAALVLAIVFNMKIGIRYRKDLARGVEKLRLGNMLKALGIDFGSYLQGQRIVDVHQQMSRCGACQNTSECDTRLASGPLQAEDIGFCENEQALRDLATRRPAATSDH